METSGRFGQLVDTALIGAQDSPILASRCRSAYDAGWEHGPGGPLGAPWGPPGESAHMATGQVLETQWFFPKGMGSDHGVTDSEKSHDFPSPNLLSMLT